MIEMLPFNWACQLYGRIVNCDATNHRCTVHHPPSSQERSSTHSWIPHLHPQTWERPNARTLILLPYTTCLRPLKWNNSNLTKKGANTWTIFFTLFDLELQLSIDWSMVRILKHHYLVKCYFLKQFHSQYFMLTSPIPLVSDKQTLVEAKYFLAINVSQPKCHIEIPRKRCPFRLWFLSMWANFKVQLFLRVFFTTSGNDFAW